MFEPRAPGLAALALVPTVVLTVAARFYPALFDALRRDPTALGRGEVWRLVSPVLVQADVLQAGGLWRTMAVFVLVAGILAVGERAFGVGTTVLLYAIGAVVGHAVGEVWQPYASGCSVAGCGVLGGIVAWLLRARRLQLRFGATLVLISAAGATWFQDIHGPPLLAGAVVGAWAFRSVPRMSSASER
jgi:rhomboid protease GluP